MKANLKFDYSFLLSQYSFEKSIQHSRNTMNKELNEIIELSLS